MRLVALVLTGTTTVATACLLGVLHDHVAIDPVPPARSARVSAHFPRDFWTRSPDAPLPSLGRVPMPAKTPSAPPSVPLDPRAADFLFVIDDSGSTRDDDLFHKVGDPIDGFLERLEEARIDWRVAITTTDMHSSERRGRLIGPPRWQVLSPATAGAAENFRLNLGEAFGRIGSANERGLSAARAAIEGARADARADFLRPPAKLHLVFVSDEEDGSGGSLDDFRNAWLAAKGGDIARLSISAIYGPTLCPRGREAHSREKRFSPEVEAKIREWMALRAPPPGESRYEKLALESSGIVGDLCAKDFTDPFLMLAESVAAPLAVVESER